MGAHTSFPFWLELEDTSEVSYRHWIGHGRADTDVTYLGRGGTHTPASTWHGRGSDLKGSLTRWGNVVRDGGFDRQLRMQKHLAFQRFEDRWGGAEGRGPNPLGLRCTATETLTEWPHPIQSQGEQLESTFPLLTSQCSLNLTSCQEASQRQGERGGWKDSLKD